MTNPLPPLPKPMKMLSDLQSGTMEVYDAGYVRELHAAANERILELERERDAGSTFAGWFSELRSGMSYRLWEQGGHEQRDGEVALYTR